jgi:hypothetical protein
MTTTDLPAPAVEHDTPARTSYHATPTFRSAVARGAWFDNADAALEWARKAAARYHQAFAVWSVAPDRLRLLVTVQPAPTAA